MRIYFFPILYVDVSGTIEENNLFARGKRLGDQYLWTRIRKIGFGFYRKIGTPFLDWHTLFRLKG